MRALSGLGELLLAALDAGMWLQPGQNMQSAMPVTLADARPQTAWLPLHPATLVSEVQRYLPHVTSIRVAERRAG